MKNRFVKLTLFLCMIMLIGTSSSAFAASGSYGTQKSAGRSCAAGNYITLFTNSNNECMNALLRLSLIHISQFLAILANYCSRE